MNSCPICNTALPTGFTLPGVCPNTACGANLFQGGAVPKPPVHVARWSSTPSSIPASSSNNGGRGMLWALVVLVVLIGAGVVWSLCRTATPEDVATAVGAGIAPVRADLAGVAATTGTTSQIIAQATGATLDLSSGRIVVDRLATRGDLASLPTARDLAVAVAPLATTADLSAGFSRLDARIAGIPRGVSRRELEALRMAQESYHAQEMESLRKLAPAPLPPVPPVPPVGTIERVTP